ncbi:hypothetical protein EAG_02843 [Camponotus floridanus]|uniref:Uncharacterized protein n=1 Tax=Camponotus floridanus TaxID=104421 RepID=E2ABY5_CAMFO|nr:hypothetical protein EAG_02843 [Camponotus floridanus]
MGLHQRSGSSWDLIGEVDYRRALSEKRIVVGYCCRRGSSWDFIAEEDYYETSSQKRITYGIERHFRKKQEQPKLDANLMPEIKDLATPGKLLSMIDKLSKIYEEKKRVLCDAEGDSSLQLYDANMANDIVSNIRIMQSEIFASSQPSCSKPSTVSSSNSETAQKSKKRIRFRKDNILSKIGRAFEEGIQSESEEQDDSEMDFLENA